MKIELPASDENPADADVHFLDDRINEYNFETTGITDGRIISYLVRDDMGAIIAGLYGWTWGGTCEVRYLWVRGDLRKRGYGTALMTAAEREATARGCSQMVLDTHSFQAPLLYQRLGFEIIGTHADYPRGHQKHYLRKRLTMGSKDSI
jgi:ribosomal protein S18 acetylase RimI-like enzyme